MEKIAKTIDSKVHEFSMAKFFVSLITLCVLLIGSITGAVTFLIDARISAARDGIVKDISPITDELKKQTIIMESRLQLLELNVADRWTATDMANLMGDLTAQLREIHPDFKRIDPYEVRSRRMVK